MTNPDIEALAARVEYILDPTATAKERIHRRQHLTNHDLRTILTALRSTTAEPVGGVLLPALKHIAAYPAGGMIAPGTPEFDRDDMIQTARQAIRKYNASRPTDSAAKDAVKHVARLVSLYNGLPMDPLEASQWMTEAQAWLAALANRGEAGALAKERGE